MTEAKRQEIKKKVAAGVKRNNDRGRTTVVDRAGERAIEAKDRFVAFAKEHPVVTVVGGVAVGVLVSSLFKGSPTRKAAKKASSRAAGLAAIGAELAIGIAQQAMSAADDARKTGSHKLGDLGDTLGDFGGTVAGKAREGGDRAQKLARGAGERIAAALHSRFN